MIDFANTEYNSEQKMPNYHILLSVRCIVLGIFQGTSQIFLFRITAALTASLLSFSSILVCFLKIVPDYADCLDYYRIMSCHLTVPGIDLGHFAHVLVPTLLFLAQTQLQMFSRDGNLAVLK